MSAYSRISFYLRAALAWPFVLVAAAAAFVSYLSYRVVLWLVG